MPGAPYGALVVGVCVSQPLLVRAASVVVLVDVQGVVLSVVTAAHDAGPTGRTRRGPLGRGGRRCAGTCC